MQGVVGTMPWERTQEEGLRVAEDKPGARVPPL